MKTIKELARDVETAQNACNLSGILASAAEAIKDLRAALPGLSTSALNLHPIMRAWSSKIADLTGNYDGSYPAEELRLILAAPCHCRRGQERDNCPGCEGSGQRIDFEAIRRRRA